MPHRPNAALGRFTVIDLTRVRAGPSCVRQLADFGANVIKIEMPLSSEAGSDDLSGPRDGPDFQNLQRNKRSLTLNLKHPRGRAILEQIVEKSDVLVENFRPDVKDRLGIGYERMHSINPRLVYASISGFGQDGPYRMRPGFDQIAQGMGGLMSVTGLSGQGPMRAGIPIADLCAGLFSALGILTALHEREVSGQGQWVKTSLLEAQIFMMDFQAARYLMTGEVPQQAGNNHPTYIPTGVFETADRQINIATTGSAIWERFCEAIGAPYLLEREEYRDPDSRLRNRDALNAEISQILRRRPAAEWLEALNIAGVPCGPIYAVDEVFADPQVQHLAIAQNVVDGEGNPVKVVGQPVTLDRTPAIMEKAAPELGEHSHEILMEFGFSNEEITDFQASGLI